ncbi:MAG: hypothetical protein Q9169_003923 [Polycauliona sp. 2 TL-2023]
MPVDQLYASEMEDIYNFDDSSYPDPSAFGLQLDNTVDTMFDSSTGGMWQPMDPPMSNISNYAFTDKDVIFPPQSNDYFNPDSYAPFSPDVPAAAPTLYKFGAEGGKSRPGRPKKQPFPAPKPKKITYPPINAADCPCRLCTDPAAAQKITLAILAKSNKERKAIGKQGKQRMEGSKKAAIKAVKAAVPGKRAGHLKRPLPKEKTPELESDEEKSEDGEYRPTSGAVKTAPAKRMRVARDEPWTNGKIPKGLQIDMNGW